MRCEAVTKGMRSNRLGDARIAQGEPANMLKSACIKRVIFASSRKQPRSWPFGSPILAQQLQQLHREHHVTILVTFRLADSNHHPLRVDVGDAKMDSFADPQTGAVAERENGSVLAAADGRQKPGNFIATQDDWQPLLLAGKWNVGDGPIAPKRVAIQKPQSADSLIEVAPGALLFFDQIKLVLADVLGSELFGRAFEVAGEQGDALDVGFESLRRVVAQTQVLEVAFT